MSAWLLWSGLYKPLLLGLGVFSSLITLFLMHRIGFSEVHRSAHLLPRLPGFWAWLMVEGVFFEAWPSIS